MSNVLGNLFGEIANAIRAKTGGTDTMKPAEFPAEIAAIPTGGGSDAGEWVMATGQFTPTSDIETITHGLGVVPDIAFVAMQTSTQLEGTTAQVLMSAIGFSSRFADGLTLTEGSQLSLGSMFFLNTSMSPAGISSAVVTGAFIDQPVEDTWHAIHTATANTIGFGSRIGGLCKTGYSYGWAVLARK